MRSLWPGCPWHAATPQGGKISVLQQASAPGRPRHQRRDRPRRHTDRLDLGARIFDQTQRRVGLLPALTLARGEKPPVLGDRRFRDPPLTPLRREPVRARELTRAARVRDRLRRATLQLRDLGRRVDPLDTHRRSPPSAVLAAHASVSLATSSATCAATNAARPGASSRCAVSARTRSHTRSISSPRSAGISGPDDADKGPEAGESPSVGWKVPTPRGPSPRPPTEEEES